MSKTLELRKVIKGLLEEFVGNVYYEEASSKAQFPYIVYDFQNIGLDSFPRSDYLLIVDIWDRNQYSDNVEELADSIEKKLGIANLPNDKILPTFYVNNRRSLRDEDKTLKRRQVEFTVQVYERSDNNG